MNSAIELGHIESVKRLPHFHENVVRDIYHVIDRTEPDRFQLLLQPGRRFLHFHTANNPRCIIKTGIRGDLDFIILRHSVRGSGIAMVSNSFERLTRKSSEFASHTEVTEAIRAIGRDLKFKDSGIHFRKRSPCFQIRRKNQ